MNKINGPINWTNVGHYFSLRQLTKTQEYQPIENKSGTNRFANFCQSLSNCFRACCPCIGSNNYKPIPDTEGTPSQASSTLEGKGTHLNENRFYPVDNSDPTVDKREGTPSKTNTPPDSKEAYHNHQQDTNLQFSFDDIFTI